VPNSCGTPLMSHSTGFVQYLPFSKYEESFWDPGTHASISHIPVSGFVSIEKYLYPRKKQQRKK